MRMKRLLVLPLVFLAGCKAPTPAERIDSALSWIATAEMAGEAWLRHTTPDAYTRQTLELSHETLRQISTGLLESPPRETDIAAIDTGLARIRERIARMAALITAKNAPDFARELDSLRTDHRIVREFSDGVEANE